jgi:hypothetical protein
MKITNQLIILSILAQSATAGTVCIWNEGKLIGLRTNGTVGFAIDGEPASNIDNDGDGVMDDGQTGVYSSINVDAEGSASLDLTGDDFDWALRFQMYDADGVFGFTENFDDSVQVSVTPILSNTDLASRGDAGPTHTDADSASSWNTRTFGNYDFSDGVGGGWFDVTVELDEKGGGAQSADGIGFGFFNGTSTFDTDFQGIGYASVNGQAAFDTDPVSGASFGVFTISQDDLDNDGLPDPWETEFNLATDDDGSVDPNNGPDGDPDSDGSTNLEEFKAFTSPINPDTDNDGYKDGVEDGGGTFVNLSKTGTSPLNPDTDDDGLLDGVENPLLDFVDADQPGTDPNNNDSDGDGFKDAIEISAGSDPTSGTQITPGDGFIANFDFKGEKYAEEAFRGGPIAGLRIAEGDSDGNFYQLLEKVGDAGNYISFESSEDYTGWETFSFQMDYLSTEMEADGFGINFLDTEVHGESGAVQVLSEEENALVDNSFGVGFKTFQSTEASITWNGIDVSGRNPYTLTNDKWASVGIDVDRDPITKTALVDVTLYDAPDRQGVAEEVYTDFEIEGMTLEDFRVQVEGRTGGSSMNFSIDNLKLIVDGSGGGNSGIVINSVTREIVNGSVSVTITWNSREGQTYSVLASEDLALGDLALWDELDDGVPAAVGADVTSFTEAGLPLDTKTRFYIVRIPE